jgi:hypothetical protein
MQQAQVGWDPISINHHLPWESRLFILYLLLVLCISLVESGSLVRQLWSLSASRWDPLRKPGSGIEWADLLAAAGLMNRLPHEIVDRASDGAVSLPRVQQAEGRFLYLWGMCSAKLASLKRLLPLTLLLAIFALVSVAINLLTEVTVQKMAGMAFLAGSIAEGLVPLALGVLICAVLYAVCGFFEGMLTRRQASWNYFCTRVKNQAAAE